METATTNSLSRGQKLLIIHAWKAICLSRSQLHDFKKYKEYENEVVDDLFKDLGITNQREPAIN